MSIYTVYQTTNLVNNKFYIGVHKTDDPHDDYLGSGRLITRAIKKYGQENFVKKILFIFDNREDAYDKEKELVNIILLENSLCYNMKEGGIGGKHSKESRENISKAQIGKKRNSEACANISKALKGRKISNKHKEKLSKAAKDRKYTREFSEAMSKALKGNVLVSMSHLKYHYKLIDPSGNIQLVETGLVKWLNENNMPLNSIAVLNKASGKIISRGIFKGWISIKYLIPPDHSQDTF
jgi:group I intron endonuclease